MALFKKHEHKHATHEFDGIVENRANKPPLYFQILYYGLISWGIAFCAYFLFGGWSSEKEFGEKMATHRQISEQKAPSAAAAAAAVVVAPVESAADGAKLYAENCAMCHGAKGEGGIGPDLRGPSYKYGRDQAAVVRSIAEGRPGGMPGFGNRFSAAEIDSIAGLVLDFE